MLRKFLIVLGGIILILIAGMLYLNNRNRTLSPPGEASQTNGSLSVTITYSRPSARDRLIFGPAELGALQPYGQYWRLGANESTEITFNRDVLLAGEPVAAGTYRLYCIPGEESFEFRLNTELGQWGYFEPDYDLDVLSVNVPIKKNKHVEQFTISLKPEGEENMMIIIEWSDILLEIPIEAN